MALIMVDLPAPLGPNTVTIRIAQTELGQGVWTSNAMMVCEELQCDWTKVRQEYASSNRDAREKAPAWTLNVMGKGATDPFGGGEPQFGGRDRVGSTGIPNSLYRQRGGADGPGRETGS